MADIRSDLLSLQYSQNFEIQGMAEANVDLSLPPADTASATVYGVVAAGGVPLADATVKLFDSAGLPYKHTLTDASGAYTISGIPAGTYSLAAVREGYRLSDAAGVTLSAGSTVEVNLACTADATLSLGTIAGVLTVPPCRSAAARSPSPMPWAPSWPSPTPPPTGSSPSMTWPTASTP